jgi:hypothetical protein
MVIKNANHSKTCINIMVHLSEITFIDFGLILLEIGRAISSCLRSRVRIIRYLKKQF